MRGFHETLRRARAGDRLAAAELYAAHAPYLRTVLRRRMRPVLRPLVDTEDLLQSVMVELLRGLPGIEDRGATAFRHLLCLKAESKLRGKVRRAATARAGAERLVRDRRSRGPRSGRAEDWASIVEEARRLRAGADRLDATSRAVFRLRVDHGLPFAEIATQLKLAGPDAARMRLARAVACLRRRAARRRR